MPGYISEMRTQRILDSIDGPQAVMELDIKQLYELAREVREEIIHVVSRNGGHLAPSLGVVELTLALLKSHDLSKDRIVWDVGHQAYAHKLLTGRREIFATLRRTGGVSGFPRMAESEHDHFGVGHSSTSISAALGMAKARDLDRVDNRVTAIIGDGSMTAGLAYEGLNQAGGMESNLTVILNDNEMSISKSVGALSSFLSRNLSRRWVQRIKKDVESMLRHIPGIGEDILSYARKGEGSLKGLLTPGMLFEAFRFNYIGPVDGHNLAELIEVFEQTRDMEGPLLLHVLTTKGKGYEPAEDNPTYYHGVGCFEPETGESRKFAEDCPTRSYTEVFGSTLCDLAALDKKIVAITAAMPEGTGLAEFAERFPDRFVDVGICEQHAVTFAAGLATRGFKPAVAIYSTFLQRSYDQIVHDVCLQNLPVTFCLDRGGLVGEDGATHHGAFDLSYLRHIPNMTLMAPKDEAELQRMLLTALNHDGPAALRYPRGVGVGVDIHTSISPLEIAKGEYLRQGDAGVVIAIGGRVHPALEAANDLAASYEMELAVYNARFVKPLPEQDLLEIAEQHDRILLVEENTRLGGFSSAVLELFSDNDALRGQRIRRIGLPDVFVEHGAQKDLREKTGMDKACLSRALMELLGVAED